MDDHTTYTLIYIDHSTCPTQLYRPGHMSSTFNVLSSAWSSMSHELGLHHA